MSSFTSVEAAQNLPPGRVIDIIGIVQESLPPKRTSGSSFMSTFTLTDNLYSSLKVRCFRNDRSKLPVPEKGHVVVLKNVKLSEFNGKSLAVSTQNIPAPWLVYKGDPSKHNSLQAADEPEAISLSHLDMSHISQLQGLRKKNSENNANASTFVDLVCHVIKTFDDDWQDRFTLYVTDYTQNPLFYEYTAKDSSNSNRNRPPYDPFVTAAAAAPIRKWEGPLGKFTLQVTLWDANAYHARRYAREGSIVRLSNVNLKMTNGYLEGKLHGDRTNPAKIDVQIVKSPDIESEADEKLAKLLARKMEYWRRIKSTEEDRTVSKRKRKHDKKEERDSKRKTRTTTIEPITANEGALPEETTRRSTPQVLEKGSDENPAPRAKQKSGKIDEGPANASTAQNEVQPLTKSDAKSHLLSAYTLCSSVKSDHPTIPPQPLAAILNRSQIRQTPRGIYYQLPFFDLQYRATLQVVDFFPSRIEDFAVSCEQPQIRRRKYSGEEEEEEKDEGDGGDDEGEADMSESESQQTQWTWRFGLVVQDADRTCNSADTEPLRMELVVADHDAERLLRMNAVDLRHDSDSLEKLRSVLNVLWGNLEEVKNGKGRTFNPDACAEILDTPPFTCCIKEHGIRCGDEGIDDAGGTLDGSESRPYRISGWKRVFRIFGTSITA
ncbi:hypothetical protein KEM54_005665 [Ascosphaera aggregata]|nr:hypothetical protein KEM54_005665 [Ascosphaera aggregata]